MNPWLLLAHAATVRCVDGKHNCEQECSNATGTAICSCRSGYALEEDEKTCNGTLNKQSFLIMYVRVHVYTWGSSVF